MCSRLTDNWPDILKVDRSYRFRLVNMACDPHYKFSIDGHDMTIIEVDGVNHRPLVVDSIDIFAGQRYSFIVSCFRFPPRKFDVTLTHM